MVSVVTITHNRAHLIGETIKSVLEQTYYDFEYIIVDDGSEDNTEGVSTSFNDTRIRYYKLPRTAHLGTLRNFGINKAQGEYIAFVDSDDLWEKDKLELQVNLLKADSSLGFCFCDVVIFRGDKILKENIYGNISQNRSLYKGNMFKRHINNKLPIYSSSTIVFKKSCYIHIGSLDETMKSGDHDFICRLLYHFNGAILFKSLTRIRRHENNHSDQAGIEPFEEYILSLERFYKQKMISWYTYKKMVSNNYYQAGIFFSRGDRYKEGREKFIRSFTTYPLNYKAIIRYFMYSFKQTT